MTLSHARALVPDVQTAPADPKGDREALGKLADWCCRYSPSYGIDDSVSDSAKASGGEDHGLWIDSTGCAHLFGGEDALLTDLGQRLNRFGLRHRLGLADTLGAAWGLARFHPTTQIVNDHETREALFELPASGLRLSAETLTLLRRLGLKTVGQLKTIPRAALAKRFTSKEESEAVLRRLDQLFGEIDEPLVPRRPPPLYRAEQAFLEPLIEPEALSHGLALLTADLCRMLTKADEGAERLAFLAFRVDGDVKVVRVGTSLATRDPVHIKHLFAEKLPSIDPGFGIEKLALHAEQTASIERTQGKLEGGGAVTSSQDERLAQLIDRLANRLGPDAATVVTPIESHIPEHAQRRQSALNPMSNRWTDMPHLDGRPSCLLLKPEPIKALAEVPDGPPLRFTWRRVTHRIAKAEGPERIAPDWVSTADSTDLASETRDYYRVEDEEGRRYWLFRKGFYDSQGHAAADRVCWFVHGVFG
jgi:protein ImuB